LLLPPDAEITDVIDSSPAFHRTYPDPVFEGEVEYEDSNGKQYRELFRIDLTFLKKRIYIRDSSVTDELKQISQTLTVIQKTLERKEPDFDSSEASVNTLNATQW
jgi:hypothetical protein